MTGPLALSLAGAAVFALCGFAITDLLPSLRVRSLAYRLALGYVLGVGGLSALLVLLSHLAGVPIGRPTIAVLVGLLVTSAVLTRALRTRGDDGREPRRAWTPVERGFVGIAAAVAAVVSLSVLLEAATNPVVAWDGRAVWGAHARFILGAGSVDAEAIRDGRVSVEVPRHPPLMPVAQAALLSLVGETDDDRLVRPLYALFLPAFLVILFCETARRAGRLAGAVAVLAALSWPRLLFLDEGGAASTYSDVPLALFLGCGLLMLTGRRVSIADGVAAGILFLAAVLTKNEGAPLVLLALAAAGLRPLRQALAARRASRPHPRGLLPLVPALALVALAILVLASYRAGIENRLDPNFHPDLTVLQAVRGFAVRTPALVLPVVFEMHRRVDWGLFWIAAPLVLFAGRRALTRPSTRALTLAIPLFGLAYLAAYGATQLNPLWLMTRSWSRFLLQLSLPILVLLGAAAGRLRRPARIDSAGAVLGLVVSVTFAFAPFLLGLLGVPPTERNVSPVPPPELRVVDPYLDPPR